MLEHDDGAQDSASCLCPPSLRKCVTIASLALRIHPHTSVDGDYFFLSHKGVLVTVVAPKSAADKGGLPVEDIVVDMDGRPEG